jgi:transposase
LHLFYGKRFRRNVVSSDKIYVDKGLSFCIICSMFIRVNKTPNSPRKSIQIVESIRCGNKVKQRIVHYVGIANDDEEEQKLKDYGQELIAKFIAKREKEAAQLSLLPISEEDTLQHVKTKLGRKKRKRIEDILPPSKVALNEIIEQDRIVEGIHEVGNVIYNTLGYDTILQKRDDNILRDLVLTRLAHPASKYKSQRILHKQFGKEHDLDAIYRMMDKVYGRIDAIKTCTFEHVRSLFPNKVDLVLFDVTTLYFESTEVDELRNFGYSKDCRFNTTQVVLALATNKDGLPIGYELFEGNKAEVKTLVAAIAHWKTLFDIGEVCFVGDRAMFTRDNLSILEANNYKYIVAAKLRSLPEESQEKVLDENNYQPTILKNEFAWINELEHEGRRLIVSYKKRRALKDIKEREQVLNKIKKLIGKKGSTRKLISNSGVKKFTHTDEASRTVIDDERVAADALWDGLHGLITNIKNDTAESIIARYAQLWIIEESFRINKHLLKIRPIFHWKPERVHAHIAICYMAFAVLRHLQYRIALTQKISPEVIIEELMQVQASIHMHKRTKDLYRVPGKFTNEARKIYKALDIVRSEDATVYIT